MSRFQLVRWGTNLRPKVIAAGSYEAVQAAARLSGYDPSDYDHPDRDDHNRWTHPRPTLTRADFATHPEWLAYLRGLGRRYYAIEHEQMPALSLEYQQYVSDLLYREPFPPREFCCRHCGSDHKTGECNDITPGPLERLMSGQGW